MSQGLVKGRDNINESFCDDMHRIHSIFRILGNRLYTSNLNYSEHGFWKSLFAPILYEGLKEVFYYYPRNLINLFIGIKW